MEPKLQRRSFSSDCMNQQVLEKLGKLMRNPTKSASFSNQENINYQPTESFKTSQVAGKTHRVKLPEKEFLLRQSPLTELLEVPHFRTIHHIFMASLALILLNSLIMDLSDDQVSWSTAPPLGFRRRPAYLWTLILSMHAAALLIVYPTFYYWSSSRQTLASKELVKLLDKTALGLFVIFLMVFIYIPGKILLTNPLPFASALVATMEQGRLLMKMYAFVRSNIPRALNYSFVPLSRRKSSTASIPVAIKGENGNLLNMEAIKENIVSKYSGEESINGLRSRKSPSQQLQNETEERKIKNDTVKNYFSLKRRESWLACENDEHAPCPSFTKHLYFLFAPTLVYRDQYPRTKKIRWNYVCWNFAQVLGCFCMEVIFLADLVRPTFPILAHPATNSTCEKYPSLSSPLCFLAH